MDVVYDAEVAGAVPSRPNYPDRKFLGAVGYRLELERAMIEYKVDHAHASPPRPAYPLYRLA